MRIKLPNSFIIELNPFIFWLFDIAEIVAKLSRSVVKVDTFESKLVVFRVSLTFLFINSIVVDIEVDRELKSRVYLFVLEFFIVEADSLQMDDHKVRNFRNKNTFGHIALLLTGIALIITDDFTLNKFVKRLMNVFETFDFQR